MKILTFIKWNKLQGIEYVSTYGSVTKLIENEVLHDGKKIISDRRIYNALNESGKLQGIGFMLYQTTLNKTEL